MTNFPDPTSSSHTAKPALPQAGSAGKEADIRQLITEDDTKSALDVLRELRDDKTAPKTVRLAAAQDLLDRRHGKAKQFIEQTQKVLTYQDLLSSIAENEAKYQQVITVEATEPPPAIDWMKA